jgi:2-keto-4-pentenoate hydratase/2-oxohepta-3-ene-1,7-dioic acid hydratase in catechol pathway/pimeloyl-ACP methyl ester carboxylesterase
MSGGDYGFAWTPHGTYARDLEHFVKWLGFTPMESLLAATAGVAKLFMREDELGQVRPGYFADCILVDGNPLENIAVLQDHSKLNLIMINGRIHKASQKDFMTSAERSRRFSMIQPVSHIPTRSNFVAYTDSINEGRIGCLEFETQLIYPMSMPSGAPLRTLEQVIELGEQPLTKDAPIPLTSVALLPPLSGRDILAVGKNYAEHAKEFHSSGYDSSDKTAQPSHPVIFTKRRTSIVPGGANIELDPEFTSTLDYEGEIGVIIGKAGRHISERDAMNHIWGYTIINDITAREVQRDHKQFYLGKSGDTYCPMGPIAVPAANLPTRLHIQTFVNGEERQDATTDDLIFSIPHLIATISLGETLQPGDVIATGTPAGVGFGQKPPKFLQHGDVVEVTVTGLGTLRNQVVLRQGASSTFAPSPLPIFNISRTPGAAGLTKIGSKLVNVEVSGKGTSQIIFIHGLGGSTQFYAPLLMTSRLENSHTCIRYDIEGHGLSPTSSGSVVSITSYAEDLAALFKHFQNQSSLLVAHSMGSLIALAFAAQHPGLVQKLVLLGPARFPVPAAAADGQGQRAATVRKAGMRACAETVAANGTSERTKAGNPTAFVAIKAILMSQDPEGYAKACTALGSAPNLKIDLTKLQMPVLIITGEEDKVSPVAACQDLCERLPNAELEVVAGVGHWNAIEDPFAVGDAVTRFLKR